ncbi:unnamed protein product [Meloidogyne enterolobii]|uniref:Uncharacterized protein n=1 Tax=Meloidogyne enterolobii TaxID=390850 RepID=A0ACB0YSI8_MELEN
MEKNLLNVNGLAVLVLLLIVQIVVHTKKLIDQKSHLFVYIVERHLN